MDPGERGPWPPVSHTAGQALVEEQWQGGAVTFRLWPQDTAHPSSPRPILPG